MLKTLDIRSRYFLAAPTPRATSLPHAAANGSWKADDAALAKRWMR